VLALSGFVAVVHVNCTSLDMCKSWVTAFAKTTGCTWRVRNTFPHGRRGLICRMDYVCQHSRHNKGQTQRKSKDTGCKAKLSIKVISNDK